MIELKRTIKVTIQDLVECHQFYESYVDLFEEKLVEETGRELEHFQMTCYTVVGHDHGDIILIEVEGYEE